MFNQTRKVTQVTRCIVPYQEYGVRDLQKPANETARRVPMQQRTYFDVSIQFRKAQCAGQNFTVIGASFHLYDVGF